MTSFYGGGTITVNGSGTGTSNYNDLTNVPIENLTSTSEASAIVLASLSEGIYKLDGYYKVSDSDETVENMTSTLVTVKELENGEKIIQFSDIENGTIVNYIIQEDGSFEEQESPINGIVLNIDIDEEDTTA